jgi:LuxR family maltose regulon positive regulatory protein
VTSVPPPGQVTTTVQRRARRRAARPALESSESELHRPLARPGIVARRGRLRPPPARSGIIPRTALVDRMLTRDIEQIVALVAPPGYGKTTVLAQWSARQGRKVAWVSVDKNDNDPSVLLADAAIALCGAELIDPAILDSLRSPAHSSPASLARFAPALGSITMSVALVLDQVEAVDNPESLDMIGELAVRLPTGSQLAVATRTQPPLAMPLLRSRRDVVEIGIDELAMDRREAQLLLTGAGVHFSDDEVDRLVEQTEGWPVGLYLAAMAAKGGRTVGTDFAFRGDDRLIGDFLRSEILVHLAPSMVEFLTRTAVLDQLSGPLCDAVLATRGAQAVLESLESSNLMLVPLDRHREWYRYHRLFRDLLLAELKRNEPELVPELHARAAHWLEANHMPETAIGHAQEAGDPDRVASLVARAAQPAYAAGRATTVNRWFEWFQAEGLIERYPDVAVLGAVLEALRGQPASAERWAAAAEGEAFEGTLPDGNGIAAWRAYLRALACRTGVARMRDDARSAHHALPPESAFRAGAILLEGLSHVLDGDHDAADPVLHHAYDVAVYLRAWPAAAAAVAERALLAIGRQDWDEAHTLAVRGLAIVEQRRLQEYIEAAVVYIVAARTAVHTGEVRAATEHLARAAHLRPLLTYAIPFTAQFQLELAKAYLALADPTAARTVLREMRDILHQRRDLGVLPREADELYSELDAIRQGAIGAASLTAAELRLLPNLLTHMSFRQIGERLHLSRHTVKTQAMSTYRKLGVSSRNEAIRRAQQIGLLEP